MFVHLFIKSNILIFAYSVNLNVAAIYLTRDREAIETLATGLEIIAKISNLYRQTSSINRTTSQNWNVSRLILQLHFSDPLKPGVKSRMRMESEQRRHLSDQQLPTKVRFIFDVWRYSFNPTAWTKNCTLGINLSEVSINIQQLSFMNLDFKMTTAKQRPLWLSLYVLNSPYSTLTNALLNLKNDTIYKE